MGSYHRKMVLHLLIRESAARRTRCVFVSVEKCPMARAFDDDYRRYEDAFEWGLKLLLLGHTFIAHFAWRESGFQARYMFLK